MRIREDDGVFYCAAHDALLDYDPDRELFRCPTDGDETPAEVSHEAYATPTRGPRTRRQHPVRTTRRPTGA